MIEDKDRFGDKLRDAERAREEEYFAKRDRELIEKLRREREFVGLCPKCGAKLAENGHDAEPARCPVCG
jgi:rubrerythrin